MKNLDELRRLVRISSQLLLVKLSDNPDDYSKKFSKRVLKLIQDHNEQQTKWAMEIKNITDILTKEMNEKPR